MNLKRCRIEDVPPKVDTSWNEAPSDTLRNFLDTGWDAAIVTDSKYSHAGSLYSYLKTLCNKPEFAQLSVYIRAGFVYIARKDIANEHKRV